MEDNALKKIEAQLSERLVARPTSIDREQLIRRASWQAGWAASERQQILNKEISAAGLGLSAGSKIEGSPTIEPKIEMPTWPIAMGGVVFASLLCLLIFMGQDKAKLPEIQQASTSANLSDSVSNSSNLNHNQVFVSTSSSSDANESIALQIASSASEEAANETVTNVNLSNNLVGGESGGDGINKTPNGYWLGSSKDSFEGPIYHGRIRTFSMIDLDWITEAKPLTEKDESISLPPASIPMKEASRQRATAHSMMRELLLRTEKLESPGSN